jgi:hypothetical protein
MSHFDSTKYLFFPFVTSWDIFKSRSGPLPNGFEIFNLIQNLGFTKIKINQISYFCEEPNVRNLILGPVEAKTSLMTPNLHSKFLSAKIDLALD